jgi:dolichol kinase
MQNIMGLIWSMAYILLILGIATVVARISKGASETSRKLIHILVGNWVFLTLLFTELWAVLLVPFTFIVINGLSLKYKLISAMERNDDSLGTVYYAVSMFVLSGAGFVLGWKTLPFIGLLTMAYGDGLAAIIGKKWGKRRPFSLRRKKPWPEA